MPFDPVTFGAAVNMAKDPATIKASVEDWLDDHPEATTTVQDGSITKAKLHDDLADEIDENTSDIGVLKSAIAQERDGIALLSADDIIQGSYNAQGAVTTNAARIRNSGFLPVFKGQEIVFDPGETITQFLYGKFSVNKTFVSDSIWYSGSIRIPISEDGYIIAVFANSTKTNITPSDYDCSFGISSMWETADYRIKNRIINPVFTSQQNHYVNSSGGISENSNYTVYQYMIHGLGHVIITPYVTNQYMNYAFLDISEHVMDSQYGALTSTGENTIPVPNGAYYIRFTSNNATHRADIYADWGAQITNKADFDALDNTVDGIIDALTVEIDDSIFLIDMDPTSTGLIKTNGDIFSYDNSYVTDFIPCIPGTAISYKVCYVYGNYVGIAFYDKNKVFKSAITAESGTSGSWALLEGESTIPADAAYFRASMSKNSVAGADYTEQNITFKSTQSLKNVVDDLASGSSKAWNGKKWCAFGTSITDTSYMNVETGEVTGKYVPFLAELSGALVTNRGIAGGTIARGGIHGGSANILAAIKNSNDLDSFDLITLEGFVNDFACAISIGQIGDTEETTMYGALYQAITYILEHSHAELVLITETTGKQYTLQDQTTVNYNVLKKNSLDLYQQDYNDVIINIGKYYGVHVIDAGGKAQINQYHPEYIIDQIHHTTLGGEQYAKTIWEELKNITPAKVAGA